MNRPQKGLAPTYFAALLTACAEQLKIAQPAGGKPSQSEFPSRGERARKELGKRKRVEGE